MVQISFLQSAHLASDVILKRRKFEGEGNVSNVAPNVKDTRFGDEANKDNTTDLARKLQSSRNSRPVSALLGLIS